MYGYKTYSIINKKLHQKSKKCYNIVISELRNAGHNYQREKLEKSGTNNQKMESNETNTSSR